MFMPEPERAVAAWRPLIKRGGRIAFSTWEHFDAIGFVREIVARHAPVPGDRSGITARLARCRRQQNYCTKSLESTGYHEVRVETMRVPVFVELPPVEWWDLMARAGGPLVALLAAQPAALQRAIREDGIRALRVRHPSGIVAEFGDALVASGSAP